MFDCGFITLVQAPSDSFEVVLYKSSITININCFKQLAKHEEEQYFQIHVLQESDASSI